MSDETDVFDQIAKSNATRQSHRPTAGSRLAETVRSAAAVVGQVGLARLFNAQRKRTWHAVVLKGSVNSRQNRHDADRFLYDNR